RGRRVRLPREAVPRAGSSPGDRGSAGASRGVAGATRRGGVARRRARRAQGDRAGEGAADGEGAAERGRGGRATAQGEPALGPAAEGRRRGGRRDPDGRSGVTDAEHPNAALVRRVFAAFGRDPKAIAAAFDRDITWRVPGDTVMSGEYHGRVEVMEFLRRTGL